MPNGPAKSDSVPVAMAVAVTGGTGTIGRWLPPQFTRLTTRLEASVSDRVRELRACHASAVIHSAAFTSVTDCERDPELARKLNVEGSVRWYQAAREAGCKRFVYVSTSHVFAPPAPGTKITVDSPVGPANAYARSKLEAEQALASEAAEAARGPVQAAAQGQGAAPELVIARVFSVVAPEMRPYYLMSGLRERARNRDFSPIPGLSNVRDFLQAEEIARRLTRLATMPDPPRIALVCSGKGTTIRELALQAFHEAGIENPPLTEAPGRPGDIPYIVGEPTPLEDV